MNVKIHHKNVLVKVNHVRTIQERTAVIVIVLGKHFLKANVSVCLD